MAKNVDSFGCFENTIKVASGQYVDLTEPTPEMIDLDTIADSLGNICRFGGHCPVFYSVAEHSLLAADLCVRKGGTHEEAIAVLLHDAAEAYIGDMVKPLKQLLPGFVEIERRFEGAIGEAFGLDFKKHERCIKFFDRAMLKAEKIAMWPDDKVEWQGFSEVDAADVTLRCYSKRSDRWPICPCTAQRVRRDRTIKSLVRPLSGPKARTSTSVRAGRC